MFKGKSLLVICILVLTTVLASGIIISYADDECPHEWTVISREESSCIIHGSITYYCYLCNNYKTDELPLTNHTWSSYETLKKPTVFKKGKKISECEVCGKSRYKSIAKLKPFIKLNKKTFKLKSGKTKKLKVKCARGDKVKSWKSSNRKVASVSKKGKIKAKKRGKAIITVILKSGKRAKCKVIVKSSKKKKARKKSSGGSGKVYWTPSGKVYHVSRSCPTLSRSRVVHSGSIAQSHKSRCCKVCG